VSDFIGDEVLDEEEDDYDIVDPEPSFTEDDEEEEEPEAKEKPKAKVIKETPKADPPTPQVSDQPLDAKLVKRYQGIRQSLNGLSGDSKGLDAAAVGLAQTWHMELKEIESKYEQLSDAIFYSTPEGRQAAELIRLADGGLTREGAMALVAKGNKMHMESAKGSKKSEAKPTLGEHYSKVANIFKIPESDMLKELKDLSSGKNIHMLDEKGGKGFEVVIDV
jgi:hypothetical protein